MTTVLLVIHLLIALAMIGVVLLQQSEGGALGIGGGGGGGMGGFMTGRGTANLLSRTTAILAFAFMCTSLVLTILAKQQLESGASFIDQIAPAQEQPLNEQPVDEGAGSDGGSGEPAVPVE